MSSTSAAQWVKFFNTAGIPSPAAATYAHKFVENRIQTDMLMDLNKEYLREMEITRMGDIIAILRHAKAVSDQNAREKVLTDTIVVPVAAIQANPVLPTEKSTKINLKSKEINSKAILVSPLPKPRRVLPEHEGKYKIKLPTGSTERSKEILAKRAKLYSDRESFEKTNVFKRLSKDSQIMELDGDDIDNDEIKDSNVKIRITGLGKKSSTQTQGSSIFARLGDKTEGISMAKQIKPILKNSSKSTGIIKAKTTVAATIVRPQKQKVLLVKKVPIKTGDDTDEDDDNQSNNDDYLSDDGMICERSNSSEKIVKFASTAEVREIELESNFSSTNRKNINYKEGIKARLDLTSKLRATKRSFNLKASPPHKGRLSPVKGKTIKLKSDELLLRKDLPVHQRLGNVSTIPTTSTHNSNAAQQISSLSKRIGRVNITGATHKRYTLPANVKRKNSNGSSTSVFDRLGFTK